MDDIPAYPGQVEAAFVLTTVGNATLESIDATEALVGFIVYLGHLFLLILRVSWNSTIKEYNFTNKYCPIVYILLKSTNLSDYK